MRWRDTFTEDERKHFVSCKHQAVHLPKELQDSDRRLIAKLATALDIYEAALDDSVKASKQVLGWSVVLESMLLSAVNNV